MKTLTELDIIEERAFKMNFKQILEDSIDTALGVEIKDHKHRKKVAMAFSLAVYDGRMVGADVEQYVYIGKEKGRDIFKHVITGMYLD